MRFHLFAAACVILLAWKVGLNSIEYAILAVTIAGVLVAELFNTALEAIVDKVSPEYHPLAKIAKDVAAGAVLASVFNSLVVGYLLFFHRLFG
ncbi:undecaprenol kinase [Methylomusa anaerophila]|uniref:Undecaprenol kinase n=2 Tax=Methylomusa anaerophila TaxID=1930071 RepID=A0A348ANZ5_9FIRM|nr:undecaprenol kinase [Methylomusa anaerophila]